MGDPLCHGQNVKTWILLLSTRRAPSAKAMRIHGGDMTMPNCDPTFERMALIKTSSSCRYFTFFWDNPLSTSPCISPYHIIHDIRRVEDGSGKASCCVYDRTLGSANQTKQPNIAHPNENGSAGGVVPLETMQRACGHNARGSIPTYKSIH